MNRSPDRDDPVGRKTEDPRDVARALERPATEEGSMHFGAKPEEEAPDGSADDAVKRAAAGWSGRDEDARSKRETGTGADPDAMSRGTDEG
ncbi:hypothetical protein [Salinarimonas ramus]|uniref:Uncharacterized protein n=1 Tax=Salinarimonas ramus TaxID=690164 RepID=A0A917QCA9_9HYPH|nr:hypothetical protein [Salinarimonas ramus]GGK44205.1 hypothetical protein GCM10011322_34170 [Salinarimonas ramus]